MDASSHLPALLPAPSCEVSAWFDQEVRPHEYALRAYLRVRFPSVKDQEDIVQEAYFRLLRARESGHLRSPKSLLFTIARNLALDVCRQHRTAPEFLANCADLPVSDSAETPSDAFSREYKLEILEHALNSLPERCRQVFILKRFQGLSYEEISSTMGISHNTISAHMMTAMAKMRDYLRAHGVNGSQP